MRVVFMCGGSAGIHTVAYVYEQRQKHYRCQSPCALQSLMLCMLCCVKSSLSFTSLRIIGWSLVCRSYEYSLVDFIFVVFRQ